MVDYKKAALTGAIAGTVASFIFGRRTRGFDWTKIGTYAAGGAGVVVAGAWAMNEVGRPIGMLAAKGDYSTGWWGHEHEHPGFGHHEGAWGHRPHEHFHRY